MPNKPNTAKSAPRTRAKAPPAAASRELASRLAARFEASLLPGEAADFPEGRLQEAAAFVIGAAHGREPGEGAVAVDSVLGGERYLRIALVNDDMPFLVDSIAGTIAAHGLSIDRLLHPVIAVRRDGEGELVELPDGEASGELRESVIYIETERADARLRRELHAALVATLADVRVAVADWPRMQAAMLEDAGMVSDPEGAALLRWLAEGMLTQLGHQTVKRDGSRQQMLGVCRKSAKQLLAPASLERAFAWFDGEAGGADNRGRAPLVVKANVMANVHRHVPLDLFVVPRMAGGKVDALSIHAGVWTSAALTASPDRIPRMRAQLAGLMDKFGFDPSGHAGKALVHALTSLPHDLLASFSDADLERIATTMMSLIDRPRPRLALVRAPLGRHLFAFVWLPRDAISTALRLQVVEMLEEAAEADVLDWSLSVEGGNLALIRFVLDTRGGSADPDEHALDARLQALVRGWPQAVDSELAMHEDPARAAALAARYADAFPLGYRASNGPAEAAQDILRLRTLEALADKGDLRRDARLHSRSAVIDNRLDLKLYQRRGSVPLSDVVPMLENFGFRVMREIPTLLHEGELGAIHDFDLELSERFDERDLLARAPEIEAAIAAVLNGEAEDDAFNRLIGSVGVAAYQANWLRAWYRYLRQAGLHYGIATVVDALQHAPQVTRGLIELFVARHDAGFAGDREAAADRANEAISTGLANVAAINDDRLLRAMRAVVDAILRTNAFADAGREALAFKLDSARVPGLPKPLPWREIWVYSPRVEGIHLRAGPVARGGLRWSDRRDDFRTEILGLMKAQRVKNAVIVPTGAKGGFYPKQLPDPAKDRDGWLAEGKGSYQAFIRTLLSLTDNIVGGKVVHPAGVVIRDGDDPYFVVAADKGTATFSDVANAIAAQRDFWLDDAFASGGSKGYDHKAMGITAKGAWLSVQRHFREMGVDVQEQPVRVAGVGDMSGDVFGNGMLLSKAIRLVAAFDHRHVFLDPDPDPAKSWAERARMFALPRSSWADYDTKLISRGGGVFPRSLKAIPLSAEIRAMLGVEAGELDPETLISAILRAPVDLLWFGGIGTYVKASSEANIQVGDPANDTVRISADEVGAKVIGEGANLGITQAGRIEFSLRGMGLGGGRINADFIDNSAGVDCSDNEVNIKIALASAKRAARLTEKARVKLLADMTGEVAALVLEDNRLQALALSIAERSGARATASYSRLIDLLEESGDLDRRTEGLAEADVLSRRALEGRGLTRPELAVMLSSAKLVLQRALEESEVPDDPALAEDLLTAFPAPMRSRFRKDILGHRLRREIISTKLANRVVNRIGVIHPFELVEEEGASLAQVTAAFVAAERLLGLDETWALIEATDMPEDARLLLFEKAAAALRNHMGDLLRAGRGEERPGRLVSALAKGVGSLAGQVGDLLLAEARSQAEWLTRDL